MNKNKNNRFSANNKNSKFNSIMMNYDESKILKDAGIEENNNFPSKNPSTIFRKKVEEPKIKKNEKQISPEDQKCKDNKEYQLYDYLLKKVEEQNNLQIIDPQLILLTFSSLIKDLPYEEALKHYIEIFGLIREHHIRSSNNTTPLNNMPYRGEYTSNNITFLIQNIPITLMRILNAYIDLFSEN